MPVIKPFKGVIYNKDEVRDISSVVAPPYDIIPKDMQDTLYRRHPENIVRLILGKVNKTDTADNNRYTRAGKFFESWLKSDVMVQDKKRALYIYSQKYNDGRKDVERIGFIGLLKLNTGKKKTVLPHENTLLAPKLDRLSLMRSVKANLSPIFVLYDDERHNILKILKKACSKARPFVDIEFDNTRNRVWRLDDIHAIRRIEDLMRSKEIFIADGHHRYEVACTYSIETEAKNAPAGLRRNSKFMMVYFVESDEHILTVLPAHRLIKDIGILRKEDIKERLEKFFAIEKAAGVESCMAKLHRLKDSCAFGMYLGKKEFYVLRLKSMKTPDRLIKNNSEDWKRLDVTILHLFLLEYALGIRDDENNIDYVKEVDKTVRLVDSGKFKLAFFLNPTKVSQVKRIAKLGERMPRKATYFYPKPLSGLVINKLS